MVRLIIILGISIGVYLGAGFWVALTVFIIAVLLDGYICDMINRGNQW